MREVLLFSCDSEIDTTLCLIVQTLLENYIGPYTRHTILN